MQETSGIQFGSSIPPLSQDNVTFTVFLNDENDQEPEFQTVAGFSDTAIEISEVGLYTHIASMPRSTTSSIYTDTN